MAKPVILTVDDEPQVLNAVERDLRAHYRGDYRIIKAGSGNEALDTVKQLKQRNTPIAIFLVDQRMPGMSGTEFLVEAEKYYPEARKVLLTAYADTQAAITSINELGLDYYLMKPWDPPEQTLYPVLDDLLNDWLLTVDLPYDGIRVIGTLWSPNSHNVRTSYHATESHTSGWILNAAVKQNYWLKIFSKDRKDDCRWFCSRIAVS